MIKFYTAYNPPEPGASPNCNEVYEWYYYNDNNQLKKDSFNQFEATQSEVVLTPKEMVSNGVITGNAGGIYGDFGNIPTDYNAMLEYISRLQTTINDYQTQGSAKTTGETARAADKTTFENTSLDNQKSQIKEAENNG